MLSFQTQTVTPTRKRRQDKGTRLAPQKRQLLDSSSPGVSGQNRVDDFDLGSSLDGTEDALVDGLEEFGTNPGVPEYNFDCGYEDYVDTVIQDGGGFYQIGQDLFIVNGWDPRTRTCKLSWYHLQRSMVGDNQIVVCRCPLAKPGNPCVHEKFLTEYGKEMFDEHFPTGGSDEVVLFSRQEITPDRYLNHFSSPSPNSRALNGCTVVSYEGSDTGDGIWSCSKDSNVFTCVHISRSRDMLQKLTSEFTEHAVPSSRRTVKDNKSVSYLPISPPVWASLPGDPTLYLRARPLRESPGIIPLAATSSCCCSQPRSHYNAEVPIKQQPCIVYGLYQSWEAKIEVQPCSQCRHRLIGPDCREFGFFNYNNRRLFTHELLDEYTSAYTSSETPFSAWVSVVARRYDINDSDGQKFVSDDVFRAAWFAYVTLQYFEGDMACPRCGPAPENTIWDGVTLAFNRKHLLPTLEPPTTSQPTSSIREKTRYVPTQQLIPSGRIRKLVRKIITGPPLILGAGIGRSTGEECVEEEEDEDEEDEDDDNGPTAASRKERAANRARTEILDRLEAIPVALEGLQRLDNNVGSLFDQHFGQNSVVHQRRAPDVYRRFFHQFSAEESVLQFTTATALDLLESFVLNPTPRNASALVDIPAIREVLTYEIGLSGNIPPLLVSVCQWILNRGRMILNELIKYDEPPRIAAGTAEKSWKETGCCYGLPKIRQRPAYPKLKHDVRIDVGGKRGAKCSKFYSQYGEKRLTGGIMVVWCTHSISYGFHCIPRGEGRNDVFSALITRWETPPKRVIYDFACALGPYCMTREPSFFSGTQFLIDDFHSVGHTKCSAAAFLKTYCNVDPRLSHINSSAGECGNSGISRIRKSVSYMSQSRAIVYTKVFLSVWNRLRIRGLN
ncbi:hypothetical protein C8F04DRAFT_963204 [Mycena alexandri]|uniref:HMG domain-containing protein n=1 Tax=Mycena alexandri TaxID=1745969 RepID=A0AAD6SM31_9AGAR|nr:hypothetical protein C8F04DRAFT_963204 [Mycena alexandri]